MLISPRWALFSSELKTIHSVFLLYADPGSGMLLWQLLIAVAFGLMFYVNAIIRKLRSFINPGSRDVESPKPRKHH